MQEPIEEVVERFAARNKLGDPMAENTMKLEVITPERSFYTGDVTFVELNTTEGEVGIYARHIPMTMIIAPGVLTITEEDGTKKKAALLKGFVEVTETTMSILAEVAEWPEDIDVERAKKAEERARKRLEAKSADIDIARAELALKRALVRKGLKA